LDIQFGKNVAEMGMRPTALLQFQNHERFQTSPLVGFRIKKRKIRVDRNTFCFVLVRKSNTPE
jgi:hypothetical protein